jgi:hypothetical protein
MATFQPGNPGGKGGARPGAGAKPRTVAAAIREACADRWEKALDLIDLALDPASAVPWEQKFQMVRWVGEQVGGKAVQRVDATIRTTTDQLLDQLDEDDVRATAALAPRTNARKEKK